MIKKHNKKFTASVVSLTMARPPKTARTPLLSVVEKIDLYLRESNFLDGASFEWVTLIIHFGLKDDPTPEFKRISKTYGDLPLTIEIDVHRILEAKEDEEALYKIIYHTCLICMIAVAKKYKLDGSYFEEELAKLDVNNKTLH